MVHEPCTDRALLRRMRICVLPIVGIKRKSNSNVFCHRGPDLLRQGPVFTRITFEVTDVTHPQTSRSPLSETSFESWRTVLLEHAIDVCLEPVAAVHFRCGIVDEKLGAIKLATVSADAIELHDDRSFADRRGRGFVNLAYQISGKCVLMQHNRSALLDAGDFAIYEVDHPFRMSFDGPFEHLVVSLTQEFLHLAGDPSKISACSMSGSTGISGLASTVLRGIADRVGSGLPNSHQLSNGVLNLLAAAVCEKRDQNPARSFDTQGESLILQVKAFIDSAIHDPELSSAAIARVHSISPRYLQKIFENEGTTVTEWIRTRRLERCRIDLIDPEQDSHSIATIASRWGLVDSSYFSRMFKAAYGISPREYRAKAFSERVVAPRCDAVSAECAARS